jgi:hypothetical protein
MAQSLPSRIAVDIAALLRGLGLVKGQSGNKAGRPKEVGHVRELARQHTEEAIETLVAVTGRIEPGGLDVDDQAEPCGR